jgi:hypothetical protein
MFLGPTRIRSYYHRIHHFALVPPRTFCTFLEIETVGALFWIFLLQYTWKLQVDELFSKNRRGDRIRLNKTALGTCSASTCKISQMCRTSQWLAECSKPVKKQSRNQQISDQIHKVISCSRLQNQVPSLMSRVSGLRLTNSVKLKLPGIFTSRH